MHVTIQELSKSFGGRDILADFSLEIQSGVRLCVCGPNGCGKSTLIKLLAGKEAPDNGRIILPRGCRLGYVEQELDEEQLGANLLHFVLEVLPDWGGFWDEWEAAASTGDEAAMARLSVRQAELEHQYGYNPEHRAKTVLTGLGFAEEKWGRTLGELSGGWRERAKLARILTAGADVLLLDEPTNHLDLEAVEWLENFLLEYEGVLVFVAHDRVFMDKVGTHLLYFSGSEKPLFRKGSFSRFITMQEEFDEQREREATRLQDEIARKMDFVRRFKAKATKARQAASRQKMAKKLEKELEGLAAPQKRRDLGFKWPQPPQSDRTVLSVVDLAFSFPDGRRMWNSLSFTLYRGQRIALVGPNGCGKSTLLKLIMNRLEKEGGTIALGTQVRVGYFSQHQLETLNADGTVLGEIRRLSDPRTTEEELMSVLGLFLLGQHFFDRRVSSLSGGEKSRLILATLFLSRSNFLVLDEPTNHLDLESREALVEALASFSGTLLMVAHDRHLLSEAAEQVWELAPDGFTVHENGYEGFAEARRARLEGEAKSLLHSARDLTGEAPDDRVQRTTGLSREEQKKLKRERAEARNKLHREMKPLQEEYTRTEKAMEEALAEQTRTEQALADPEIYGQSDQATALLKRYHELQEQGEGLLEKLAEMEEKLAPYEAQRLALLDE